MDVSLQSRQWLTSFDERPNAKAMDRALRYPVSVISSGLFIRKIIWRTSSLRAGDILQRQDKTLPYARIEQNEPNQRGTTFGLREITSRRQRDMCGLIDWVSIGPGA